MVQVVNESATEEQKNQASTLVARLETDDCILDLVGDMANTEQDLGSTDHQFVLLKYGSKETLSSEYGDQNLQDQFDEIYNLDGAELKNMEQVDFPPFIKHLAMDKAILESDEELVQLENSERARPYVRRELLYSLGHLPNEADTDKIVTIYGLNVFRSFKIVLVRNFVLMWLEAWFQ